jgi:hypothetical protein
MRSVDDKDVREPMCEGMSARTLCQMLLTACTVPISSSVHSTSVSSGTRLLFTPATTSLSSWLPFAWCSAARLGENACRDEPDLASRS